jgi:hypothetical protein
MLPVLRIAGASIVGTIILSFLGIVVYHPPSQGMREFAGRPTVLQIFGPHALIMAIAFVVSPAVSWKFLR